jgi:hypothetical protein
MTPHEFLKNFSEPVREAAPWILCALGLLRSLPPMGKIWPGQKLPKLDQMAPVALCHRLGLLRDERRSGNSPKEIRQMGCCSSSRSGRA